MDIEGVVASRYWREAEAEIVVNAWKASGLSLGGFARRYGCSAKRVGRWAARIAAREGGSRCSPAVPASSRGTASWPTGSGLRFVELVPPAAAAAPDIEVAIGRAVVRVPVGFDSATLHQIIAVLEASC